jgi:hypothetical protein
MTSVVKKEIKKKKTYLTKNKKILLALIKQEEKSKDKDGND